jgi:Golgi phosphoprotein 3
LSFFNDSISYVLRGCILMELSLRNRIRIMKDSRRRPLPDRYIEVIDAASTGEVLLDEALRFIKKERQSVANWIDLLSGGSPLTAGETWNPLKVGYQLRQVRERLAKGLVDKGILRTEKHNFLFFDMATHPLSDADAKSDIRVRVIDALTGKGQTPSTRTCILIVSAVAANLLSKLLGKGLSFSAKESLICKADDLVREFATSLPEALPAKCSNNEIVAAVLNIFTKMDNLLY